MRFIKRDFVDCFASLFFVESFAYSRYYGFVQIPVEFTVFSSGFF